MRIRSILAAAVVLSFAGSANAAVKAYDASADNGLKGDFWNWATNLCPPQQTTPGILQGFAKITDNGAGTVTIDELSTQITTLIDIGPAQLTVIFGPGAFIFIDSSATKQPGGKNPLLTTSGVPLTPQISNSSGVGSHGPSSSAPGGSAEWGLTSGWEVTGRQFCLSSPVTICNGAGFGHGQTVQPLSPSSTYNMGTWSFDGTTGDYQIVSPFVERTSNGGLQNSRYDLKGAFVGSSLPALPLVGFGALALSLAVIGGRSLIGKK